MLNYFEYSAKVSFDFKLTTKKFLTTEIPISITWQTLTHQKIVLARNGQDTNVNFYNHFECKPSLPIEALCFASE